MSIKTIIKPKQGGKTTDLLAMSAETGYPIVVKNRNEGRLLKKKAKELSLTIPEPITAVQILNGKAEIDTSHVLIDDAEYFINYIMLKLIGCGVAGLTMCTRNEKGNEVTIYGEDLQEALKNPGKEEEGSK